MGYDIRSFFALFDDLQKFKKGTDGQAVISYFEDKEDSRFPVEAFIGLKIESLITKFAKQPQIYLKLYKDYKEIAVIAQELFEKQELVEKN